MKKTNTNRIISSIIIAMMVVTSLIIPVSATETETLPVYQSSNGFSVTSSDGTWVSPVNAGDWDSATWKAEVLNTNDNTYSAMTAGDGKWTSGYQFVNGTNISPPNGIKANVTANKHLASVKTFKVPYSGEINISYATVTGADNLADAADDDPAVVGLAKTKFNKQYSLKIRKRTADGENIAVVLNYDTTNETDNQICELTDPSTTIYVEKGQLLSFEVLFSMTSETDNWGSLACDPIITYTEVIDGNEIRNTFKSSENFGITNDDGTWDNGIWSAEWRDCDSNNEYKAMTTKDTTNSCYSGDKGIAILSGKIRPSFANAENIKAHSSVLTFTAPKSGKISISYNEDLQMDWNGSLDYTITRRNVSSTVAGTIAAQTDIVGTTAVAGPTASVYVAKGDKISFEVKVDDTYTSGATKEERKQSWATLTCDPIITYDETVTIPDVADRTTFKSSEYFDNTNGDGAWDSGIWTANEFNATDNTYTAMTTSTDAWAGTNGTKVDADEIMPVTGNGNAANYATYGGVKTFTAPQSGKITISYADVTVSGNTGAVVKYAYNQGMKFRVRKQTADKNTISTVFDYAEKATNASDLIVVASGTTTEVMINKGDTIHFEVMRMDAIEPWQGVYCDPIITYTAIMTAPETRNEFRSAEFYDTNGETAKWDSGVWQAWFYDWNKEGATTERDKYQIMTGTREDDGIVKWTNNASFGNDDYQWNSKAAYVGPEYMRVEFIPNNNATEYEKAYQDAYGYPIGRDYPVKVFKAPKAGVVSIDAATFAKVNTNVSVIARIMKMNATSGEPVQVWPASGFKRYLTTDTMEFNPITTALAEGDMLMFELAFKFGDESSSPYDSGQINWDPTVTYTDGTGINDVGVVFKSGEDTVTGVANIAAAETLTATVPVCSGTAFDNAMVVVGIYDASGMLVRVGMSESTPISATEPNNVPVTFGSAASGVTGGSIKVFLWDSLSSLTPIAAATPIQ